MNEEKTAIQRTSTHLCRLVTALVVTLTVLLLLERFGAVGLRLATRGFTGDLPRRLAAQAIAALPEFAYILALWWIRQTLAAFAAGKLYTAAVTRMLDRVGTMLAVGALTNIFLVPAASRALGFGPGYLIPYDVSGFVLAAVGLALKVIAHVLRRAADIQAELEEIF